MMIISQPVAAIAEKKPESTLTSLNCPRGGGEFINICGECVGGKTERLDNLGVDSCGVCDGRDICRETDQEEPSDKPSGNGSANNRTKITGIFPALLDLALSPELRPESGAVSSAAHERRLLRLEMSAPDAGQNLTCSVSRTTDGQEFPAEAEMDPGSQAVLKVGFDSRGGEGSYGLECSSTRVEYAGKFYVVDSRRLKPMTVSPKELKPGRLAKVAVTVSDMFAPVRLLCFALSPTGAPVWAATTSDASGNRLSTVVDCSAPLAVPKSLASIRIGVSYTFDAMNASKTVSMDIKEGSLPPTAVSATMAQDLTSISVEFEDNLSPANDVEDLCAWSLTEVTIKTLGKDPVCRYSGNVLTVALGSGFTLRPDDALETKAGQRIVLSAPQNDNDESGPLVPRYTLEVPRFVCRGSNPTLRARSPAKGMTYQWYLSFNATDQGMPGGSQRKNLMVWLGVRQIAKQWAKNSNVTGGSGTAILNSSLLVQGMDYRVTVVGIDPLGRRGPEVTSLPIRVLGGSPGTGKLNPPLTLSLSCPPVAVPTSETVFEARAEFCGGGSNETQPDSTNTKFSWKMTTGGTEMLDTSLDTGPVFRVPPGVMTDPSADYLVEVAMHNTTSSTLLTKASCRVKARDTAASPTSVELEIDPPEMSLGTGQDLQLDASNSKLSKGRQLQYSWNCRKQSPTGWDARCSTPGPAPNEAIGGEASSRPSLRIKRGSLSVGRYLFTLVGRQGRFTAEGNSTVEVVRGDPPSISVSWTVDGNRLRVRATAATDLLASRGAECIFGWTSLPQLGYDSLDMFAQDPSGASSLKRVKGVWGGAESFDFPLEADVRAGSRYRLGFRADCGPKASSYRALTVETPAAPPRPAALKVVPDKGVAMETDFEFRPTANDAGGGLKYRLGYWLAGGPIRYLETTDDPMAVRLRLPPGDPVATLVNVCDARDSCALSYGNNATVTAPKTFPNSVIQKAASRFGDKLDRWELDEALGAADVLQKSAEAAAEPQLRQTTSRALERELVRKMEAIKTSLAGGSATVHRLKTAVRLLDMASSAVAILDRPDRAVSSLVDLRNAIEEAMKNSKVADAGLPTVQKTAAQERSDAAGIARRKRSTEEDIPEIQGQISAYLATSSAIVLSGSLSPETVRREEALLLRSLPGYARRLCTSAREGGRPLAAHSRVATLSVVKIRQGQSLKLEVRIPDCIGDCRVNASAQVVLPRKLMDRLRGDEVGPCVGGILLAVDMLEHVSTVRPDSDIRWSSIYGVELMRTVDGQVISMNETQDQDQKVDASKPNNRKRQGMVLVRIPLRAGPKPANSRPQCRTWSREDGWTSSGVKTVGAATIIEGRPGVECKVPVPGYYSVFFHADDGSGAAAPVKPPQSSSSDSPLTIRAKSNYTYAASFVMNAEYKKHVEPAKRRFDASIKTQLKDQFGLPDSTYLETSDFGGKTLVKIYLVEADLYNTTTVLPRLAKALGRGELDLRSPDDAGTKIKVEGQPLRVTQRLKGIGRDPWTILAAILAGVGFATVCAGAVAVAALVVASGRRRRRQARRQFQIPTESRGPKYLRLKDEAAIETIERAVASDPSRPPVNLDLDSGLLLGPDNGRRRRFNMATAAAASASSSNSIYEKDGQLPGTPGQP